jgi:hypothetical protein
VRAWSALLLAALASGCSFEGGEPYGLLTATLDARYATRADRDLGDGWQQLASEYHVRLTRMHLVLDAVELVDGGDAGPATFDPANPPAGYSLCHNGHCHRDDGALVEYADIESTLAAGSSTHIAKVLTAETSDLLSPEPASLSCEGHCLLGRGTLVLARVTSSRLVIEGQVRDGLPAPRLVGTLPFRAEVAPPIDGALHQVALDVPLDDEHPPGIALTLDLDTSAALFDGVAFDAAAPTSGVIGLGNDSAIAASFAELALNATVTRHDL